MNMKIVRIKYSTKPEYVQQNQANIWNVMTDLQKLNKSGINYHCCLGADGKSFTHTAFFESEEDERILLGLPVFKHFQEQLMANGIETPPKQELLSLVGSSKDIFKA
jgi:hypothetical protein